MKALVVTVVVWGAVFLRRGMELLKQQAAEVMVMGRAYCRGGLYASGSCMLKASCGEER